MRTNGKKFIISAGILLLAAMLCGFSFFQEKTDEYRSIQVYEIVGSAVVDRDGVGSIDAYVGMMLRSGDRVHTGKESSLYFKMDEDKYALLEPESTLRIEASGTSANSKTSFYLESGALVSRLDNKLSPDSVYEVNTPNSTMAVRGTIFRVQVTYDENMDSFTNVFVFDGTVTCQLIFKDGSAAEEVKQAQPGMLVRIHGDDTISEYLIDDGTVDYGQLPAEVLYFLKAAVEEGIELPIDREKLEAALAELGQTLHVHRGGTASCIAPAVCADCGQAYGEKNPYNHTSGTETRNQKAATCTAEGYTGDIYCLGCNMMLQPGSTTNPDRNHHTGEEVLQDDRLPTCHTEGYTGNYYCSACGDRVRSGETIAIDPQNHDGDIYLDEESVKQATCHTEGYTGDYICTGCGNIRFPGSVIFKDSANHDGERVLLDVRPGTCQEKGYSGNIYCSGCNQMLEAGEYTDLDPNNHVGDTYVNAESVKEATCCDEGYTGDICCSGCGAVLTPGTTIPATGDHPAAVCGVSGHHAHDGMIHEIPGCGIAGHCVSDGLDHSYAPCGVPGHYLCDGSVHGDNCKESWPADAEK